MMMMQKYSNTSKLFFQINRLICNNAFFYKFFRVKSLNNGRTFSGKTFNEGDDFLSQRIKLIDHKYVGRGEYLLRIDFTDKEFNSSTTFCRDITEIISRKFQII